MSIIKIVDASTGEEIEREMTAKALAAETAANQSWEALQDKLAAQSTAKAALLERLGITAEEAKALLS